MTLITQKILEIDDGMILLKMTIQLFFLPFPLEIDGKYDSYNKDNPGVYIKVIN
jgi:hypothetical protein